MKNITYQITINNKGVQYIYDKINEIPVKNNHILINLDFFNNIQVFNEFINCGGQEREYRVLNYKELENGVQKNRVALV